MCECKEIDWEALKAPFPPEDIEWRVQQSGKSGEKFWAMVLAYVTNRAIMDRLDTVVGPGNWKNRFEAGPGGGIICGISIRVNGEWVEKWDGADKTQIEEVKGGLSGAMKRAGVQWGIGRYLYNLEATFAKVSANGKYYAKAKEGSFKWDEPDLPAWALPKDYKKGQPSSAPSQKQPEKKWESRPETTVLEQAKKAFDEINNLNHLANHWNKHAAEYKKDKDFEEIVKAKDKRKDELVKAAQSQQAA